MAMASGRPLKVGLHLPHWEGGLNGATPRGSDLIGLARLGEAVGFDSLWVADHAWIVENDFYEAIDRPVPAQVADAPAGLWDGWTLLTAVAAVTSRIELGPLVACTGFRNPALLAKMADTLDEISGGRLILGLGAGDSLFEHRAMGYPTDRLVSRFEEAVIIIRRLLREGALDFAGTYYRIDGFELRPRGPRPNGPPIMIGALANRPRMLRLTAQYADIWNGWVAYERSHADVVPPLRDRVDQACRRHGRDPGALRRSLAIQVAEPGKQVPESDPLTGSPDELAAALRAMAAEGIDHVQIFLMPTTPATVEGFGEVLARLDRSGDGWSAYRPNSATKTART
jgi:alkanesulfonate monooxygenase SsuD/methylene tetrahydromethanopterin reductase-like flavin-dependent oxidoreductase (luciferase family)